MSRELRAPPLVALKKSAPQRDLHAHGLDSDSLLKLVRLLPGRLHNCHATTIHAQGMKPNEEIPALISALALTAIRSGIERWTGGTPEDADDTPMPYVERAAALVNSIFTK